MCELCYRVEWLQQVYDMKKKQQHGCKIKAIHTNCLKQSINAKRPHVTATTKTLNMQPVFQLPP